VGGGMYVLKDFIIIIIIPPQSTAGHRPLQWLIISLDLTSLSQLSAAFLHKTSLHLA
jgi:hypothetical protein